MKYLDKIINWGLCLFIFLLPWQTRWIFKDAIVNGAVWEYGRYSLYGTEILLLVLIILGIILKLRCHPDPAVRERLGKDPIVLTIIVLIVYAGLSIIWSTDKTLALYSWLKLIEGAALFWLIVKSRQQFLLNLSLIASGLVQGLLAIYQFFTQSTFAAKWLGLALIQGLDQGASVIEFLDQRWLRAYGAFPHPNILGGFLAVCLIVAILGLWQLNKEVVHSENISKKQFYLNIFYWFSVVVMLVGLLLSFSRSAWLAFIIAFLYLIFYSLKNKLKAEKKVNLKLSAVFILIVGLFLISFPYQLLTTRFNLEARLEKQSIEQRVSAFKQSEVMFKEQPVLGVGLGNYTKVLQAKEVNQPASLKLQRGEPGWAYQPVHNLFQLVLNELGLIGFLLFIFLIVNLFRSVSAVNYSLLFALGFMALFDHYLWSLYFGVMLWWLVWGLGIRGR